MFVRYFVCKINQLKYLEIDKETYNIFLLKIKCGFGKIIFFYLEIGI